MDKGVNEMELVQIFKQGGFIMYPLLIFSVIVWTVAIQKIWFLINFNKQAKHFYDEGMRIIHAKRFNEMEWLYKNCPEIIAKPHSAIFEEASSSEEWDARMSRRLNETNLGLKKNVWMLGTIATSAPFVGLFGTVWGIMGSFKEIGAAGKAGFAIVSAYNYILVKIGEALASFKNGLGDLSEQFNAAKK
jgi:biopolymer transport protein ExbB